MPNHGKYPDELREREVWLSPGPPCAFGRSATGRRRRRRGRRGRRAVPVHDAHYGAWNLLGCELPVQCRGRSRRPTTTSPSTSSYRAPHAPRRRFLNGRLVCARWWVECSVEEDDRPVRKKRAQSRRAANAELVAAARLWELDRGAVEESIGYHFRDGELLTKSVDAWSHGHGALETIGDAINDLAVLMATARAGGSVQAAAAAVTNDALDAIYAAKLAGLARFPSGDVVESIVGAVHLDGGFNAAATVGVRLCLGQEWVPIVDRPMSMGEVRLSSVPNGPMTTQFGRIALEGALIEDLLHRSLPKWPSQAQLSEFYGRRLARLELISRGRAHYGSRTAARGFPRAVRVTVGNLLEERGWVAAAQAARKLVLDGPCLLYTSPSPRDLSTSRMPSSA